MRQLVNRPGTDQITARREKEHDCGIIFSGASTEYGELGWDLVFAADGRSDLAVEERRKQ